MAGSFSAEVHGALMVAWVGAVGRGPVAAGLPGSSCAARGVIQQTYVVRTVAFGRWSIETVVSN